ncbi:MAG TPA: site-specific integrase [Dehalococcoidia bacterium]|nr:site-specific integrase [Dehalococcoidia bacterium]
MPRRGNGEGTYRRRGRGWQAGIRIAGHRYWVSGRTRQECREKLQALLERHRQGQLAPPSRLTLQDWAALWLREGEGRWRPTTLRRRRQVLAPLLERLGRVRLSRLDPLHLSAALLELRERGMGSRSLELCYVTLQACLGEAQRRGLIGQDPLQRVPRPRHERREAREWGLEEMRRFLRAALQDARPIAQMLAVMLMTGLRPGEALGLRWDDIDLAACTLTVRRSVTWAGSEWHIGRPKTRAGERTVALPSLAVSLLSRLPREGVYLFWQERPPYSKRISEEMTELCQRAGVPRRPAHYLRHAHASLLAAGGLDVKTLQRRLGHSQASVTLDVYAHALTELDRRAAQMVDGALGG